MSTTPTTFTPKGGMCVTCKNALSNCSDLPFHSMPVIDRFDDVARVRCTGHTKAIKPQIGAQE